MILEALHDLYGRLKDDPAYRIARRGESLQKITFRVVLKESGELVAIQDARVLRGDKMRPRVVSVLGSAKPSGSGLNPCFLWDNAGYMLGFVRAEAHSDRARRTFQAFRDFHLEPEKDVSEPAYSSVCRFLETWDPKDAARVDVLSETAPGFGVFQIQGHTGYVHEVPGVRAWWHRQLERTPAVGSGQCIVTGEIAPIEATHPRIKGVRGAQSAGAALVSFNDSAYESYGKEQGHNAPVSSSASFHYTSALNALLNGPRRDKHVISLGDATVVFWTNRSSVTEDMFAQFASSGAPAARESQDESTRQKVENFLSAIRDGREAYGEIDADPHRTMFYLLALSPNAARLSVRFFYRDSVAALLDNLRNHHEAIRLCRQPARGARREDPEFPPLWLLLRQTARDAKDIPPMLAAPLLRAVISGAPYPASLFSAVLRRIRADRIVNYARLCVIKGYLTRNCSREVSMGLDLSRPDPAYRLGRLFAALEKTQKDALGDVGATVRDRFYGAASATPGSVLPRLLRTYQHHLAKLEGGRKVNREKLIQEIVAPLGEFPAHLALDEQGLFAVGYYHQIRAFYERKRDAKKHEEGTTE